MKPPFTVIVTPHYERLFKKLLRSHSDLAALQARVGEILAADPYNVSREHHIKKLEGVAAGERPGPPQYGTVALPVRHFRPGGMAFLVRPPPGRYIRIGRGRGGELPGRRTIWGYPSPAWTFPTENSAANLPALAPKWMQRGERKANPAETGYIPVPRNRLHYTYHYRTAARRPQGQQKPSDWTDSAAHSKKISCFVIFLLHSAARGSTLRLFKVFIQYSRSVLDQVYWE
jgi:hypothetical protein